MRILMVHGMAQGGKNPATLKRTWIDTLAKGLAAAGKQLPDNIDFDFPYYGDTLDGFVSDAERLSSADTVSKGPGRNTEFEEFMTSALVEIKERRQFSDAEITAQMTDATTMEKGPQNWWWIRAIAKVVDDHFSAVADFAIEAGFKEVFHYVRNRKAGKAIDAIVEAELTDEPTLVIGHSLGSVVCYNMLRKNASRFNLLKYISVGSPLGIRAVSGSLGIPENPSARGGWYNAYDKDDIVALNPLDSIHFPTDPQIVNYGQVRNETGNQHGIIGYLNDPEVARQVANALR